MTRVLRPGCLVPVGERVWVVDAVQPVAAVLDAATGAQVALVGWPQVSPGPRPRERVVLPAADGLWVQQPDGPLVRLGDDGVRTGHHVPDTVLGAVTAHGAWCAPAPRPQVLSPVPDGPPPDEGGVTRLHLAREGEVTRVVRVDAAVQSLGALDGDLLVEIETGEWDTHHLGASTWELEPRTTWLRLEAGADVPDRLGVADHAYAGPPDSPSGNGWRWGWLPRPGAGDDEDHEAPDAQTASLDWFVGRDPDPESRSGPLRALALEPGGQVERWRLLLGDGHAKAVAATPAHLWVSVEQAADAPYSPAGPVDLLRVDAATGEVETVLGAGSVDITALAWPDGPPPVDADDYARFWQRRLGGLEAYWTDESGAVHPLSAGLSDPRVEIVGTWPKTALHVTFRWARRPGVRLRRVVALYDELGRAEEPEYADIHIMEDLDTGRVPSAPASGAELLDF